MTRDWRTEVGGSRLAGTGEAPASPVATHPDFDKPDPETGWSLADIMRLQRVLEALGTCRSASQPMQWGASVRTDGKGRTLVGKSRVGIDLASGGGIDRANDGIAFSTVLGMDDFEEPPRVTHETPEGPTECVPKNSDHHANCEAVVRLLKKLAEPPNQKSLSPKIEYSRMSYLVCKNGESGMLSNAISLSHDALLLINKTSRSLNNDVSFLSDALAGTDADMVSYGRSELFAGLVARGLNADDLKALGTLEQMLETAKAVGQKRGSHSLA